MNANQQWVAFLTEDEDDFAYWQYGFNAWAAHLRLEWFATGDSFFARPGLVEFRPTALLLDGLMPMSEEPQWLRRILDHDCCQNLHVVMLSDLFLDDEQQLYLNMGAAACLTKPTNQDELQRAILSISRPATA